MGTLLKFIFDERLQFCLIGTQITRIELFKGGHLVEFYGELEQTKIRWARNCNSMLIYI